MHLVGLGLIVASLGCSSPEGMWRDQYVFVADNGTVVPLTIQRQSDGSAELKGQMGIDGSWRSEFYRRYAISGRDAPYLSSTLTAWSSMPGSPARLWIQREGSRIDLGVRTPASRFELHAWAVTSLGESVDPEGTSVYRVGRASMWSGDTSVDGWLVAEETRASQPRQRFVDYGDFVFVIVANGEAEAVLVKRSRSRPAFNHGFRRGPSSSHRTRDVSVELTPSGLNIELPELGVITSSIIADRRLTRGTAPGGGAVVYETLLLRGAYSGVAFTIRPDDRKDPR